MNDLPGRSGSCVGFGKGAHPCAGYTVAKGNSASIAGCVGSARLTLLVAERDQELPDRLDVGMIDFGQWFCLHGIFGR
jgi:hypothetical protein